MTNRHSWMVALFAIVTSLVPSTLVEAQRVAVSYSPGAFTPSSPRTELINLGTGVLEMHEPFASGTPVFTSDGRFLLLRFTDASGSGRLEIRDLITGFRSSLDLTFYPSRAHPRRLAVYGYIPGGVGRLDTTGLRPYTSCAPGQIELTVDGSRLLVFCQNGNIESIDETTGALVAIVAAGPTAAPGFAINADGSRALVVRVAPGVNDLVLFDIATGTEIMSTPMPGPAPPAQYSGPGFGRIVGVTPSRDAVVVTTRWFNSGLPGLATNYFRTQLLEFATLAPRRQLAVPYDPQVMAISPNGERAFVGSSYPGRGLGALLDLDLGTGQQTALVSAMTFALGAAFPPLAPTLHPPVVNGEEVTIGWSLAAHSPEAQRFLIHVGSRSGAIDLGTLDVGGNTSLTVPGVPPGRYFVRVTATNITGPSSPSTEVVIEVPARR